FPNPFKPTTTIYITLTQPDQGRKVCCKIFDCLGREVTALSRQINSSGRSPLFWNGCDTRGRAVPSGIYFARLMVSHRILATSRLLKLK
ncbi:MAG: T9SS type A sorting domain-containing protein, partial [bacterium]